MAQGAAEVVKMAPLWFLPVALVVACDQRACLAQSDLFAGFREPLIEECCLCLAFRGTRFPGASCAAATIVDGGVVIPDDAGIHPDAGFAGDDLDDARDPDEIPCLCNNVTSAECEEKLNRGERVLIVGACISQGTDFFSEAPCERACKDVLVFDPLTE